MGIEVAWDDEEQTIIRADYAGTWTWDEFVEGIHQSADMMKTVNGRVDIIENMKPGVLPVTGSAITHARNAMRSFPENTGLVVAVTNSYVRAIGSIFVSLNNEYRAKVMMTDTLEQARAVIQEHRAKDAERE